MWQWIIRDFILSDGDVPGSVDMTVIWLEEHPSDTPRPLVLVPPTAVVSMLEDPTAREVALVEVTSDMGVRIEVGVFGVARPGQLGGGSALEGHEGREWAADTCALVAPSGVGLWQGLSQGMACKKEERDITK